ncbi:iron uptake transporter permease EfeU [Microbacterium candidum]|uniref:Iron uptake transporter permease EfeU n=1 Tax=Microbacterium candidum TaxID=3041922 RepID=A0ABT7N3B5_9MICO|nr:iron uptake transporter permease EfeU [Microbacterium sp. ASV49]MDL9981166.1 iron uptake transporter permease EfeU [Microbacterium sp. ASV49]
MLATFLIGLREGLEAALVVGILAAYLTRIGRRDVLPRVWMGIGLAVLLALGIGAILTFGAYELTSTAQEVIGGVFSLIAVAMVTWMIFWMQKTARNMKKHLEGGIDKALATGGMWALVVVGFVSVAREGIEAALLLWSMTQSFGNAPTALLGAVLGILVSAGLGWLLAKGMLKLDLRRFFLWTSAFLVIVAAGVLAYAVKDLQEAGVLAGPFSAFAPIVPTTGEVAVGWGAFPFGWAFDVSTAIHPGDPLAVVLQATVGFMPQMSWLQVVAWVLYIAIVGGLFIRAQVRARRPKAAASTAPASAPTTTSIGTTPAVAAGATAEGVS